MGSGGSDTHQALGHILEFFFGLGFAELPVARAELIQRNAAAFLAKPAEHLDILDRNVEPCRFRIAKVQDIVRRAVKLKRLQPFVAANTVIPMHHQIAGRQRARIAQELLRLAPPLGLGEALSEYVLLTNDRELVGLKAAFEWQHREANRLTFERGELRAAIDFLLDFHTLLEQ